MVASITSAVAPHWVASRLVDRSGTRWVGVDGFGAAGKTTLAAGIAAAVPNAVVLHIDDFGRAGVRGWDRALFVEQVLNPLLAGRAARYLAWDLAAEVARGWCEVPPGVPVVVEGVSATDDRVAVPWDLTLWVDVPAEERRHRIHARDEPRLLERWRTDWWPNEERYAAEQRPWERVDAIVTERGWPAVDRRRGSSEPAE
jgi:uridine kinase